jgi:uncharacterized protein (DUF1810 family)
MHQPGEARRRYRKRHRDVPAQHLPIGADSADVAQDRRVKLDVAKGLSGTVQRNLILGRAVGIIESGLRCPSPGKAPEVVDGLRIVEPTLDTVEPGLAEADQRREVARLRYLSFDHCVTVGLMQSASDRFDLQRFVDAQELVYPTVLDELRASRKRSHWIWFVFPQIAGLGSSATAARYAISSLDEARAYLRHEVLGPRLHECTRLVNAVPDRSIGEIFGSPDDMKVRSSMTLFAHATEDNSDFLELLARYYDGNEDPLTLQRLT